MSRVNETNAATTAAARQRLQLLDHVVRMAQQILQPEMRQRRALSHFGVELSMAVPERRRRSASDELAFSRSSSTRSTSPVRLTQVESPSPRLLAAQEAWDRAFEALFGINPARARAHLPEFSRSPATAKSSRRVLIKKEGGEYMDARPDYGADGGRDGTQYRKAEQTVPTVSSVNKPSSTFCSSSLDGQTVLTVSPFNESYIPSFLSLHERPSSALPANAVSVAFDTTSSVLLSTQRDCCVRVVDCENCRPKLPPKPAIAFAVTTNEPLSVRGHSDLCTCALQTTEKVEARSARRKGGQRWETPVSHPNRVFSSSLLCCSGKRTTERATHGPKISVAVSAMPCLSSGKQMPVHPTLPPEVVLETTPNAKPFVGDRSTAVDRGVRIQSRTARQVGAMKQKASALNPDNFHLDFSSSYTCSSDVHTSGQSAFAPPKMVVVSVAVPNATQRGRDRGYFRTYALDTTEGVVQSSSHPNAITPKVQSRDSVRGMDLQIVSSEMASSQSVDHRGARIKDAGNGVRPKRRTSRQVVLKSPLRTNKEDFYSVSFSCCDQRTERAAPASNSRAAVSATPSASSALQMRAPSASVHPKNIEVGSAITSKLSQPAGDRGCLRTGVFEPPENVAQATPHSTPIVQQRLPERACEHQNGLESVVRFENRTTHRADKARYCTVTLDARSIEDLPLDEAERRRDKSQVAAAATRERFAAATARDDIVVSPLANTPTAADIASERFGGAGGMKWQAAVLAYPDMGALDAHAEIPSLLQNPIQKMHYEPLRAGIGDDHSGSSVLRQSANGRRSVHRIDAQCDSISSSSINFEMRRVRIDEEGNLEQEAALDSWLPQHARNNRARSRDGASKSSTCTEIKRFHKVSKQVPPVPMYSFSAKGERTTVNFSQWTLSGQVTEQYEAAAGTRALVARRRCIRTDVQKFRQGISQELLGSEPQTGRITTVSGRPPSIQLNGDNSVSRNAMQQREIAEQAWDTVPRGTIAAETTIERNVRQREVAGSWLESAAQHLRGSHDSFRDKISRSLLMGGRQQTGFNPVSCSILAPCPEVKSFKLEASHRILKDRPLTHSKLWSRCIHSVPLFPFHVEYNPTTLERNSEWLIAGQDPRQCRTAAAARRRAVRAEFRTFRQGISQKLLGEEEPQVTNMPASRPVPSIQDTPALRIISKPFFREAVAGCGSVDAESSHQGNCQIFTEILVCDSSDRVNIVDHQYFEAGAAEHAAAALEGDGQCARMKPTSAGLVNSQGISEGESAEFSGSLSVCTSFMGSICVFSVPVLQWQSLGLRASEERSTATREIKQQERAALGIAERHARIPEVYFEQGTAREVEVGEQRINIAAASASSGTTTILSVRDRVVSQTPCLFAATRTKGRRYDVKSCTILQYSIGDHKFNFDEFVCLPTLVGELNEPQDIDSLESLRAPIADFSGHNSREPASWCTDEALNKIDAESNHPNKLDDSGERWADGLGGDSFPCSSENCQAENASLSSVGVLFDQHRSGHEKIGREPGEGGEPLLDPGIGGSVDTNDDGVLQRSLRILREISRESNCKQPKQSLQPYHLRDNHRLCFSFDPVDECSIELMKYELGKVFVERDLEFRTHRGAFYFPTSNMMEAAEKVGNHSSTTMQSNHRAEMCGQADAVEIKPTSRRFYLSGAVRTWNMKFMDKECARHVPDPEYPKMTGILSLHLEFRKDVFAIYSNSYIMKMDVIATRKKFSTSLLEPFRFSFRQISELAPSRKQSVQTNAGEDMMSDVEFMLSMNIFPYSNDDDYWVTGESEVSQLEFMLQKYSVNSLHGDNVYYVREAMDDGLGYSKANNMNLENKFVIDAGEPNEELWCNTKVVDVKSRNMFVYLLNTWQAGTSGISAREAVMIDLKRFTDCTETVCQTVALVELFTGWVVDSNRVNHPNLLKLILVLLREGSSSRKWVKFAHGGASVWDGWGKNCHAD
ncbi:hypothetical protein K438DRAFT_1759974 [Mycena galopus ATCC 62051]|nr:hypothetical protein K438DRAFT_1759974 [Mycena galopus ATCC 62051]